MPLDRNRVLSVLAEPASLFVMGLLRLGSQIDAIRRKVYEIADIYGEVSGRAWRSSTTLVHGQVRVGPRVIRAPCKCHRNGHGRCSQHPAPHQQLHAGSSLLESRVTVINGQRIDKLQADQPLNQRIAPKF
jgi:hypothetical protein